MKNRRNYWIIRIIVEDQDIKDTAYNKEYKIEKRWIKLPK